MSLQERFEDAAKRAKSLPNQSNETLLDLYSLYKQGSSGDVSGSKPGPFDFVKKAKYEAWEKRQGMSQDEAMEAYIALVDKLGA